MSSANGRYLGVDPGLNCSGYAVLSRRRGGPALVEGGVIRSARGNSLAVRVREIGQGFREVLEEHRPDWLAIEELFSFGRNPKTALLLAHARGAILFVAAELEIPIIHFTPTQIKRLLTGSGRAPKAQMQHTIQQELGLSKLPEPHDVADASAVALCLYHSLRRAA